VVNKTVIKKNIGKNSAFSFDSGDTLAENASPF